MAVFLHALFLINIKIKFLIGYKEIMAKIALDNVRVDIPIFNSQGRSLKKAVLGFATGGKIGLTEDGKTIITALDGVSFDITGPGKVHY